MNGENALLRAASLETLVPESTTAELAELLANESTLDTGLLGLVKRELLFVGKCEDLAKRSRPYSSAAQTNS